MADVKEINHEQENDYKESDPLKENAEDSSIEESRNFFQKCVHTFKNITVEPSIYFFINTAIFTSLTSQNLYLDKACRVDLNFTSEICNSLKSQTVQSQNQYERDAQKLVTLMMAWKAILIATVPCIMAMFVGSWSDKTGYRKIFILIPIFGQLMLCLNGVLNTYYLDRINLTTFVIIDGIIEGFSGGWSICIITVFAFISSITSNEDRTFRMGIINFCITVAFPLGMGMIGVFLKTYGYYGCYGLAAIINLLNFLYTAFILKDPERTPEQKKADERGYIYLVKIFFDIKNVKNTVRVLFKKDLKTRRLRLCVLLIIVTLLFGPSFGETSILYISTRYRFSWDEVKFSIFQVYNFVSHTIGTMFSIVVFSKYLKWHDSVLGIISTLSKIAASFLYCFALNERIFYLAPLVDMLNGTSSLAVRSIISKLVSPDEYGKVSSIFGLTENITPLVYIPLYTRIYAATMEVLPGGVFLVGSSLTIPALIVFIWLFAEHRREVKNFKLV